MIFDYADFLGVGDERRRCNQCLQVVSCKAFCYGYDKI